MSYICLLKLSADISNIQVIGKVYHKGLKLTEGM